MFFQYDTDSQEPPMGEEASQFWAEQLATYLAPSHQRLDASLDRRVVGNLMATVAAIVQTRTELTTSEVGSVLCGPAHTDAGTQRLQRALHHAGWQAEVIEEVLWEEAESSRQLMEQRGETKLGIWDRSVLEKPESEQLEGLGAVRESRVRRLARSRKGLFNQPSRIPVSVRGFEWESLLLVGASGVPQVAAMCVVGSAKGRTWAATKASAPLVESSGPALGAAGAPHRAIAAMATAPGSGCSGATSCVLWCAGRKATSSSTRPASSAKPLRWRAANAPLERRGCCGTRIAGSLAARGCSLSRFAIQSIRGRCGWWWCDRAGGVNPGICSPMNPSRRSSKPLTSSSLTSGASKLKKVSVFRNANC